MHVNSKLDMHDKGSLYKENSWQKHLMVKIIQNCTQGKHKKQQVYCSVMLRNSPKQNTIFSCLNWLFFYAPSSISWLQMGCYCRLMKWHLIAFVRVSVAASLVLHWKADWIECLWKIGIQAKLAVVVSMIIDMTFLSFDIHLLKYKKVQNKLVCFKTRTLHKAAQTLHRHMKLVHIKFDD